jgi:hypothetical protein
VFREQPACVPKGGQIRDDARGNRNAQGERSTAGEGDDKENKAGSPSECPEVAAHAGSAHHGDASTLHGVTPRAVLEVGGEV